MNRKYLVVALMIILVMAVTASVAVAAPSSWRGTTGINVVLNKAPSKAILNELSGFGKVVEVFPNINGLTMRIKRNLLDDVQALPYVAAANVDAERHTGPVDIQAVENITSGLNTWDLDAINVTDLDAGRTIEQTGEGVYVAVLDTGLLRTWRAYLPVDQVATEYAKSFGGGGGEVGHISEQPNKWERDTFSHGTHVASTILGYWIPLGGQWTLIEGVAPKAMVIPVKVLNQNGSGWSSVVAAGISYIGGLKAGPLADYPVVINMSLGGPELDALEKAAMDYAIAQGVIIVAAAGNEGEAGMGYPGAYEPVISAAASGWVEEWIVDENFDSSWWWAGDVPNPTAQGDFYITDFSSRELPGQDLDVSAPGSWVVGPWQVDQGHLSWFFVGGTSMSSPHVAGTVALMAQKDNDLTASEAESIIEGSAITMDAGCRDIFSLFTGPNTEVCWDNDATGAGLLDSVAAVGATP